MKKTIFLLSALLCLSTTLISAQVVQEDIGDFRYLYGKDTRTTIHHITYKNLKGDRSGTDGDYRGSVAPTYDYTIEKTPKGSVKYWRLGFTGRCARESGFTMNKGGKILIKLFDDSTITLVADKVDIREDYKYGTWFTPSAKLTDANFNKITQIGVKKVRFETFPKVFDVEYDNDIIGVFLKDASKILKDKISNPTDRMSKGF